MLGSILKKVIITCVGILAALAFFSACSKNYTKEKLTLRDLGESNIQALEGQSSGSQAHTFVFKGTIKLKDGLLSIPDGRLFIVVRESSISGHMIAGSFIDNPEFPLKFAINRGDFFKPLEQITKPLFISAHLDQDRDPITKQSGDLEGWIGVPLEIGSDDLVVTIFNRTEQNK